MANAPGGLTPSLQQCEVPRKRLLPPIFFFCQSFANVESALFVVANVPTCQQRFPWKQPLWRQTIVAEKHLHAFQLAKHFGGGEPQPPQRRQSLKPGHRQKTSILARGTEKKRKKKKKESARHSLEARRGLET